MSHRDYAPNLSAVMRDDPDDGSREELAEYYKEQQSDTLCVSCGNTDCPLDDKRATQCVEYYPLNPVEDACPNPTTTTT